MILLQLILAALIPTAPNYCKTVGYHRMLNPESIISMNPDLGITRNDIGPANVLPQIEKQA